MIDKKEHISLNRQLSLLALSKSSYYYKPRGENPENLQIMRIIDEHHLDYPTKGVLRMQDFLRDNGFIISEKRVRRLMRLMNINVIYPKKDLSRLGQARYIRPYLLRNLEINRVNQVWQIDITYIPMAKGFMYLTAIIDVFSRFVPGWSLSNTLEARHVHQLMEETVSKYGAPEIINSDQGSQFTCEAWIEQMKRLGIKVSMDGKGRATDNAYIERLWRTVKQDYVYLNPAQDGWELEDGLDEFFKRYNFENSHQGIGRRKPAEVYGIKLNEAA